MNDNQKLSSFLQELSQLSVKYDLYIGGCGCCGSPHLSPAGQVPYQNDVAGHYATDGTDNLRWQNPDVSIVRDSK